MTEQNTPAVEVKIGDWLSAAWELFKQDVVKYSVAMLIVGVLSLVTCMILLGPMMVSLCRCFIRKARGEDFTYGDLFDGLKRQFLAPVVFAMGTIVAFCIVCVALMFIPFVGRMAIGAIALLIAPVVWYTFMEMAVAETSIEIGALVDLVKRVFDRIKNQYGMLIVWFLIIHVILDAGAVACCVGAIVTAAFSTLAACISYLAIFKAAPAAPEVAAPATQQ